MPPCIHPPALQVSGHLLQTLLGDSPVWRCQDSDKRRYTESRGVSTLGLWRSGLRQGGEAQQRLVREMGWRGLWFDPGINRLEWLLGLKEVTQSVA